MNKSSFENARILVVGDIMLDIYKYGTVSRISPEAPVPVVLVSKENVSPGGAANVAMNMKELGCDVELMGYVGDDHNGEILRTRLHECGVCHSNIVKSTAPTISKTRVLSGQQHMIRYDDDSEMSTEKHRDQYEALLINRLIELSKERFFDVVVISDYAKGTITETVIDIIKNYFHVPIICDIKPSNSHLFKNVFCIVPNLAEAKQLVEQKYGGDHGFDIMDLQCMMRNIKNEFSLGMVVITLGRDGMILLDDEGQISHMQAYIPKNETKNDAILDTIGAGDTVISVLSACVAVGYSLISAVGLSNIAAGIVVRKVGTATCSVEEIVDADV